MVKKAILIGLDSATPEILEKLAREGAVPNIKKLMEEGVYGVGFGGHPTNTGANWASMDSGATIGTSGATCMWTHFEGEPLDRLHSSFLSTTCRVERLWEAAERAGKRPILLKYTASVPPTIKRGIQVEGYCAPWYGQSPFEIAPSQCYSNKPYPLAEYVELHKARNWEDLPESERDPLEGVIKVRSKSVPNSEVRYRLLIIDSGSGRYDKIILTPERSVKHAVAKLSVGEWSNWIWEEFEAKIPAYPKYREGNRIIYEEAPKERYIGTYRFKLIDLSPDAEAFRLYRSQIFPTRGFTWPESVSWELIKEVGPFQEHIGPNPNFNNWIDDETFLEEMEYQANWLGDAAEHLLSHHKWDLFLLQWHGLNHAQHAFWGGIDPVSPWYSEERASKYWGYFKRFYGMADRMVGKIIKNADEETLIIVVSDHGHIPYVYGAAMVGNALAKAGLLKYKKKDGDKIEILWDETKAYAYSIHVYVNLKGREPRGIVEEGEEYEETCDRIIAALYSMRDPKGRCPIAVALRRREAELIGLGGDRVGDVIYATSPGFISLCEITEDGETFHFPRGALSVTDDFGKARSGPLPANTSIHGTGLPSIKLGLGSLSVPLIAKGEGIKRGYVLNKRFRLIDIAPTIAYYLGIPPPKDCEGSVISEIFE